MELKVFSIFDEKAKVFSNPFYMGHNGQALRAFSDLVQDKQSSIAKHPGDYKLYLLGTFNDVSGKFTSLNETEFLAHASDYIADVPELNS